MDTKEQKAKEYAIARYGSNDERNETQYEIAKVVACRVGFEKGWDEALKSQWISVKDRMPSEWQSVFILLIEKNDIKVTEAIYIGGNGTWAYGDTLIPYNKNILAWMPIPSFDTILQANKDVLKRLKG